MNSPYLLVPISILILAGYLLSYLFSRLSILTNARHRKIWNTLLLVTAIVTLLLGLILTIEVNYKLEWPWVKQMLKWHVDFGIAMSIVAVFHLVWHWSYYRKLFSSTVNRSNDPGSSGELTEEILTNPRIYMIMLGSISIITQVLLIREITTVFQGNELLMAWSLGTWMLLTGLGAFFGRNQKPITHLRQFIQTMYILIASLPLAMLVFIDLVKNSLFLPGVLINPLWFLAILFLVFSPICLLSGFTFSTLVHVHNQGNGKGVYVYILESIGSVIGGLLVSFGLIQWLSILQSMLLVVVLLFIILLWLTPRLSYLLIALSVGILWGMTFVFPVNHWLKSALFVHQHIIESKETKYGNLTVTENGGQVNFYENGSLLFTTDNLISSEEYVHYVMMQHPNPRNVLLISGGISGMLNELLKYRQTKQIDYVELDPWLIRLADTIKPLPQSSKIHLIFDDGRRFIMHTSNRYDVMIFALPDPSSLQVNRYYTLEFIQRLKEKLNSGGMVLFGLTPAGNYMSDAKTAMEASVYNALKESFAWVQVIPGEKDYFIASDYPIDIRMAALSAKSGIETQYVNGYYFDDNILEQRSRFVQQNLTGFTGLNTDNKPIPVFYHTLEFLAQFNTQSLWILIVPMILLFLPLLFMKPVTAGIFAAGFTGSSIEMIILFTFQTIYGNVYSAIGLLIAIFMGGLAAGAILGQNLKFTFSKFRFVQLLIILYALTFPMLWSVQKSMGNPVILFASFILVVFIISALVGLQFAGGTVLLSNQSSTSVIYSADLLGSALGMVIVTVLLVPLLGIISSCLVIAGLNLLILGVGFLKRG